MAGVQRVRVRLLLVVAITLAFPCVSWAVCTAGFLGVVSAVSYSGRADGLSVSDLSAVCAAAAPNEPLAAGPSTYQATATRATSLCGHWSNGQFVASLGVQVDAGYWTPRGAFTLNPADPACDVPQCPTTNLGSAGTRWTYSGSYPGFGGGYCIDGCSYDLFGDEGYDKESNTSVAHGYMKGTGASCSGPSPKTPDPTVNGTNPSTVPSATDPNPSACQAGQVPYTGTVNGKTVTVCGTADKSSSTGSTSTSSSGSTTTNNNGTQTTSNTSGTSGSTSKTTCENGSCTTTTSSTSSSGGGASAPGGTSTSGTETKTEPKEKFCADNPTSPLCTDSNSSFGGGCGAFQCEGDAVQCATARATQELLCATKVSDSDPALLAGQQAVSGGDRPAWHPRSQADSSTFSLASMLDTSPLFGTTGNCIADKTVPMLGKTLTIPFSRMCTALELLGAAFLASCYLGAAYIVFRK